MRARPAALLALLAVLAIASACARTEADSPASTAKLDTPLADTVPAGTKLIVGDPQTKVALKLAGLDKFSFEVEYANISGGPQTTEAFRANALDLGSVADIPPIHATWTGLDVRIVAAQFRQDPVNHPIYQFGIAPGVTVKTLADLKDKRIAYSPGQAQGALVLRVLQKAGLTKTDVELIELPSTGDVYPNSLSSGQVDVAPIGGTNLKRYLAKYGKDGASAIKHGLRDDPGHLYAQTSTLADPAKAAAIKEYVKAWARAQVWIRAHPKEWIEGYYVKDQGLTVEDGQYLVDAAGALDLPASWDDVIARHQQTIDLLAKETGNPLIKAEDLYDRRYEKVAAEALEAGGGT
ncbi:ABC transporter substrate-binding protein [Tenggerimyces flavus]|uniref:ABC transporter substrate-binding protein n=1 Tax=Tenggerimyces flavus TaxID=1708749 RepID=A0ABV7YD33_9ACTN|nr:ABC transporter substrate-binding protein [Tenggerimyces flavus]MBM7788823.1 sulfonate transport system substrate-binding protein [Tenggerimyces flavus]